MNSIHFICSKSPKVVSLNDTTSNNMFIPSLSIATPFKRHFNNIRIVSIISVKFLL